MGFSTRVTLHVLLMLATSLLMAVVWVKPGLYLTFFCLSAMLLLQLFLLLRYLDRTNRELSRFLDAVAYQDFSQSFSFRQSDLSFKVLGESLNRIMQRFQQMRQEKEKSSQFLQVVLQRIPVAVLVMDENLQVNMLNAAAKRLFDTTGLRSLMELEKVDASLPEALDNLGAEGRKVVEIAPGGLTQQLAVSWTEFHGGSGGRQTIICLQNIRMELDRREIAAWQDLIRILSHEIMNSLTPISSLSRSVGTLLKPMLDNPETADRQTLADVDQAMETIARRSEGLLGFVDNYRSLARLPQPQPEYMQIAALFERTLTLMQAELQSSRIKLSTMVDPPDLTLYADPELLSQALINLVKNARDALTEKTDATIKFNAHKDRQGHVLIEVNDNGCGVKKTDLEKIWIPFFSTKKAGSGIGLSLTRQIVTLHGGTIQMTSEPGQGTRVLMVLGSG